MFTVVVLHIIFIWPGNIVVDHVSIIFKLLFCLNIIYVNITL